MSISSIRTNVGNAGYIKLIKETDYGAFNPGGTASPAIVYNQGGASFKVMTETVARRGIAGLGSMENIQLRHRVDGSFVFDQEMDGHAPLLLGLFGGVATEGTGPPYDNFFWSTANLPSWNLIDHWPPNLATAGQNNWVYTYGVLMNSLTLTLTGGDPLTAEYGMLGARGAAPATGGFTLDNYKYLPAKPQHFARVEWMGRDLVSAFHSFTLTINNNLREDVWPAGLTFGAGVAGRQYPARGEGGMTVEFTAEMYADENYYDTGTFQGLYADYVNDNIAAPLIIQIDVPSAGVTNRMVLYCPNMKVSGETLSINEHGAQVATVTGVASVGTIPFSSGTDFPLLSDGGQINDEDGQMIGVQYSGLEQAATI